MKVFLIRHAESKANVLNVHGGPEIELSENGIRQAELVAGRLTGVNFDSILCSRYKRAMQTARIIAQSSKKKTIHTNLLNEWRLPSELKNQTIDKEGEADIWDSIYENADNHEWYYSDEENISDLRKRAEKLLKYIKSRKEKSLVVVMHGAFMGVLLGFILFGKEMTGNEMRKATKFFMMENTGITELFIREDGSLKLITFNDFSHLK